MKTKNKKKIVIGVGLILVLFLFGLLYFFFNSKNENDLTLEENKWIDSNRQNVVDIAIINDAPVLSYDGEGLVYDYLDYITRNYSLNFNVVPHKLGESVEYEYKMDIVSTPSENDIVLLKDTFVIVTKSNNEYNNLNDISNIKLGIATFDKEILNNYFNQNNVELFEFEDYTKLKQSLLQSAENSSSEDSLPVVDGVIIPKVVITKEIIENNYNVSYELGNLNKYFVLNTAGSKELNSIMKKSFNVWEEENYNSSYNSNLLSNYFKFKNITDIDQKKLQSKSYTYGFVEYGIYNYLENNEISGLNGLILKDFNTFSGLSISYTKYNSVSNLLKEFNSKEVDFMLNLINDESIEVETFNTVGVFNKELAIISGISNTDVIDGINDLKGKNVLTVKDSYLEKYLLENDIKVRAYNNFSDLSKDFTVSDIAIVDLENYNYYKTSVFKDSKINSLLNTNDKYMFILNNTEENSMFKDIFNFYLNYNSIEKLMTDNYSSVAYKNVNIVYLLVIIIIVLCIYIALDFSNHIKYMLKSMKKNKKINLTKEEKIKYIDQLTSLKNRAYLNSRIDEWDESEVYPQAIIVIDLNNVSYINDNYGREEGDKVITEAANVLIMHQMQNSEIIRTDGNEFLIYLVGYSEKQIIAYLRKLNKELKTLSHGFGAASGYSIINDAIKTIDDAVNEATLDMKNNKEDIDY